MSNFSHVRKRKSNLTLWQPLELDVTKAVTLGKAHFFWTALSSKFCPKLS